MSVLLQLSDPHFGTEQAPVVKALAALAQQQQPDLLVLSGDITQRAKRNQFAVARAFTDRLGAPLLAILGNHDIPLFDLGQRLFHPYARYREALATSWNQYMPRVTCWCSASTPHAGTATRVAWSLQPRSSAWRSGCVAEPGQLRVVVHQPIGVLRATELHNLLHGHAQAQQSWAAAGCDVVLGAPPAR